RIEDSYTLPLPYPTYASHCLCVNVSPPPPPLPPLSPILLYPFRNRGLFHNELTQQDLELLSGAMHTFHMAMNNASIPYFMFEVTGLYKFYDTSGHSAETVPWKTPFLDVSFYAENSTHLWDIVFTRLLVYNKSDIFPLVDRPFLGQLYPAPRDPLRILQVNYNLDHCSTGCQVKTVACSSLLGVLPFVQHVRGPAGAWCEEVLTFRGQVLSTFVRNSTNITVC
ncbi:unnamed protein product, partial [Candidula unifasciata]